MSFYVTITDSTGREVKVKVSYEIYQIFEEERKERERLRKEKAHHYADDDVDSDLIAYHKSLHTPSTLDTIVYRSQLEQANRIIQTCTPTQQRRFYLNRILGYSLTDIAKIEKCTKVSVQESVSVVLKKLEKIKKSL